MKIQLIIFVFFVVVSIIRAIKNNVQAKAPGQHIGREAPERQRKVQSDIDAFLEEVGASSGEKPRPQRPKRRRNQSPQHARREETAAQRGRKSQSQGPNQRQQTLARQPLKAASGGERSLGSGISEHVDTYMSQHVDSRVDDFVEVDIADSVEGHLGNRSSELPGLTHAAADTPTAADNFRELLKSRQGVRQAILLNEVLNRPRALRR